MKDWGRVYLGDKNHARAQEAARRVAERYFRPKVQAGPFVGMMHTVSAECSQRIPKLLGTYEAEIHGVIEHLISNQYSQVLNIGSAEGYYAVGLALRLPQSQIAACDTNPVARQATENLAKANGVSNQIAVTGTCNTETLQRLPPHSLVVCDIEGGELDLLDPVAAPALKDVDILVEIHEFGVSPTTTDVMKSRFAASHNIDEYHYHGQRDLSDKEFPPWLPSRWHGACSDECRRYGKSWLMLSKSQPS